MLIFFACCVIIYYVKICKNQIGRAYMTNCQRIGELTLENQGPTERYGHLMGKSIYTYYKERLIEIGGKNKCLYLKNIMRKGAYDIGRIFEGREDKVNELLRFLWSAGKDPLTLIKGE